MANRCWPGYVPVPGKKANQEGSCRPKAKSKLGARERAVRKRRKAQLDRASRGRGKKYRSAARHSIRPPKGARTSASRAKRKRTRRAAR
jgi:hypothetical protein